MNINTFSIAFLAVTATILAVLLGTVGTTAYAEPSIRGGQYIVAAGNISDSSALVYVIDLAAQKLNVYDPQRRGLVLIEQVDLEQAFKQLAAGAGGGR